MQPMRTLRQPLPLRRQPDGPHGADRRLFRRIAYLMGSSNAPAQCRQRVAPAFTSSRQKGHVGASHASSPSPSLQRSKTLDPAFCSLLMPFCTSTLVPRRQKRPREANRHLYSRSKRVSLVGLGPPWDIATQRLRYNGTQDTQSPSIQRIASERIL